MALDQSVLSELLAAFQSGEGLDLIRESVRLVCQELIETELSAVIGAERYERSSERTTERNGHRSRVLTTKAGDVDLAIPKLRRGSFFPSILEPCRRIDQALYAVVMEAYVHGVSSGVRLVISDQHAGLVAAIARCFQGAAHQRCRVHFARNLSANIPKGHQEMVAAAFRTIFAQVSPEEIAAQWDHVATTLTGRFDKAAALMARAKEEVLAFRTFPRSHWRQIWSTNPLERLNKELKRRSRVVGIFPNEAAAIRLSGAVITDIHDEWAASERRYFSEVSMADLYPERDDEDATPKELALSE
jgi:transposase-like protein